MESTSLSHSIFWRLSYFCSLLTWILIAFGTIVRLKGAGLACPDWPLCYGKVIPPPGLPIALEVGHRFVATILGILCIVLVILAYQKTCRHLKNYAWSALILVSVQGIFGGLTVTMKLSPIIVTWHLIGGNLVFALFIYMSYISRLPLGVKKNYYWKYAMPHLIALIALFIVLFSGGYNSTTYSGYSCQGFPGCYPTSAISFGIDDIKSEIPKVHNLSEDFFPLNQNTWIHMIHRILASLFGIGMIIFAWKQKNKIDSFTALLVLAQIAVGITNALFAIPVPVSALHTAIAATLVGLLTYQLTHYLHNAY